MTKEVYQVTEISRRFDLLRERGECALIPFITAGDPNLKTTEDALRILDRNGADFIEVGVPYSDPLADGPIIQASATRALLLNVQLDDVINLVATVSPDLKAPIILFTYYNLVLNRGIHKFLEQISVAGVKGLVIPDLPLEEAETLISLAITFDIDLILMVAPTSSKVRMLQISQKSQGFVYLVGVIGVTGKRDSLHTCSERLLAELRSLTSKSIGIGFGISNPDQAKQMRDWGADAVIVGSAFVELLADNTLDSQETFGILCRELKISITSERISKIA
jgi:tryptophan synthase alpha chain